MDNTQRKRKRKRTCLVCKQSFDDDYRQEHNKKYHKDLLKAGEFIAYKAAGAPANPFVLAAQRHKKVSMESFYRKEFKAVLDTQIKTFADVHNNCKGTIKPLIDALHPGKEIPSL